MGGPPDQRRKFPVQLASLMPAVGALKSQVVQAPVAAAAGVDWPSLRRRMVERLCELGCAQSEGVISALLATPRHVFIDSGLVNQAYEDTSLPIGFGQTISKPSVVARMLELLMQGANAKGAGSLGPTLEIGTGCGYQTALLARLSRQVISVERLKPLYDKTLQVLAPLGLSSVRLVYGDGMCGHPPNAPYHSMIAAAAGDAQVPAAWLEQLAIGGRLVAPVQHQTGPGQVLLVIDKTDNGYIRSVHEPVNFVPLVGGKK